MNTLPRPSHYSVRKKAMEDQLHNIIHMLLLVCYIGPAIGNKCQEIGCSMSQVVDTRSYAALLSNENTFVNGICLEENGVYSREMYFPHSVSHSDTWKDDNLMTTKGKSSIDKRDNKSKPTSHHKMEIKKHSNNKKLKGSKRQRKKEKKKKIGKKRKKS